MEMLVPVGTNDAAQDHEGCEVLSCSRNRFHNHVNRLPEAADRQSSHELRYDDGALCGRLPRLVTDIAIQSAAR